MLVRRSIGWAVFVALTACTGAPVTLPTQYVSSALEIPPGYVATPNGYYDSSCIRAVGEASRAELSSCNHPRLLIRAVDDQHATGGWILDSEWTSLVPATQMIATFNVPKAPPLFESQVDYFFPGMEPRDGTIILQPVLQFGPGPAGGGDNWGVASWSCGPSCIHSPYLAVDAGDVLEGSITGSNCTPSGQCAWEITTRDVTSGASTTLRTTGDAASYVWLFGGVLEAYGVDACAGYPADGTELFSNVAFSDANQNPLQPNWHPSIVNPNFCATVAVRAGGQQTELFFTDAAVDAGSPPDAGPPDGFCAHPVCAVGGILDPSCDPCAQTVCNVDYFCCSTRWDDQCIAHVNQFCVRTCP